MEALYIIVIIFLALLCVYLSGRNTDIEEYYLNKLKHLQEEESALKETLEIIVEKAEFKDSEGIHISKRFYLSALLKPIKPFFPKFFDRITNG